MYAYAQGRGEKERKGLGNDYAFALAHAHTLYTWKGLGTRLIIPLLATYELKVVLVFAQGRMH